MELNDLEPGHVMFQVQAEIKRGHDEMKLKPAPHSRSYSILNTIIKGSLQKKNCIFYDIVIIRETTYPPSLIMT